MKKLFFSIFFIISIFFLGYLLLPNPGFPEPPPNSLQSREPADTETPFRRAYFTDYTRAEVLGWYENQLKKSSFFGVTMPTFLLNYPPEEAATIIRDQTRSTFLQEIVHPFRESVYVNGFEPTNDKDAVIIEGRHFRQKIIIRLVTSSVYVRLGVFIGILICVTVLFKAWREVVGDIIQLWRKKN